MAHPVVAPETTAPDIPRLFSKWDKVHYMSDARSESKDSEIHSEVLDRIIDNQWAVKGRKQPIKPVTTHIILSGEHGGVLSIPDKDHEMFMEAYTKDIACGVRHYIREQRTTVFPLAVDLDHKPKEKALRWKEEHLYIWVRTYQTVLKKCYGTGDIGPTPDWTMETDLAKVEHHLRDPFLCIVTMRDGDFIYYQDDPNHALLWKKDYKQGFRLSFPNLMVSAETARVIRQCVLRELVSNGVDCRFMFRLDEKELIGEAIYKQLNEMLDESVYINNGFRMIGSAKTTPSFCASKKKNPSDFCSTCHNNNKFDIGTVYRFYKAFPSNEVSADARLQLHQRFKTNIQEVIRACSVRIIPPQSERPGFECKYEISTFLLATTQGAQSISAEHKRALVRTQRLMDPVNRDDLVKYEAILRYFRESSFPDYFPFRKLTLHDIKSIHMNSSSKTTATSFTILVNTSFCAMKKTDHSTPKSYFTFHPTYGMRQKCHSQGCKKDSDKDYYQMPSPPFELYRLFFPSDSLRAFCGIVEKKDLLERARTQEVKGSPEEGPETDSSTNGGVGPETLTTEQMMQNASVYFPPSQNDISLAKQIATVQEINFTLKNRLEAYASWCRESPHTDPASIELCDPNVLIKKHRQQQGLENNVFRASTFRGRGGGGGRGGRGGGGGRKRTRTPAHSDFDQPQNDF